MNRRTQTTKIFFTVLSLFVLGCILVSPKTTADPATAVGVTDMPPPTKLANTATLSPTDVPTATATVYPPVFDPKTLGDNRELDSFILTRKEKTTGGGEVTEKKDTIGFIKEPFSAYHFGNLDPIYFIGGRFYEQDKEEDYWFVSLEPDPTDIDFFLHSAADMRGVFNTDFGAISAQFVDQDDFGGILANHFTFDQTNLSEYASEPAANGYKIDKALGDFYLAQDGNYLLYFHVKVTGNVYSGGGADFLPGVREITEELTSINQLKEITLPADYPAFELELGLPLPAGSRLQTINSLSRWVEVRDYYLYAYVIPVTVSRDDFLEFYRNLAPTNGWTVSQVGPIPEPSDCSEGCVILKKGNVQLILLPPPQLCATANYNCFIALYYR